MTPKHSIAVVGAGVVGFTTGIRLLEAGFEVAIYAEAVTPKTTSDVAGAYWYPYPIGPGTQVEKWARASYEALAKLAENEASGVTMRPLVKLLGPKEEAPWWADWVQGFAPEPLGRHSLSHSHGRRMIVPFIEPPIHMPWLLRRFRVLGGQMVRRRVATLTEMPAEHRLAVCSAGLGARELAADPLLSAVKGQVVRVTRPSNLGRTIHSWTFGQERAYVIPRSSDVVLGGTYEHGENPPSRIWPHSTSLEHVA